MLWIRPPKLTHLLSRTTSPNSPILPFHLGLLSCFDQYSLFIFWLCKRSSQPISILWLLFLARCFVFARVNSCLTFFVCLVVCILVTDSTPNTHMCKSLVNMFRMLGSQSVAYSLVAFMLGSSLDRLPSLATASVYSLFLAEHTLLQSPLKKKKGKIITLFSPS